jgi:hypothetical protein
MFRQVLVRIVATTLVTTAAAVVFPSPVAVTTIEVVAVAEEAEETGSAVEEAGAVEEEVAVTDRLMIVRRITVAQGCSTSSAGLLINYRFLERYLEWIHGLTGVFGEVDMVLLWRYLKMAWSIVGIVIAR